MSDQTMSISIKGKRRNVSILTIGLKTAVITRGSLLRVGEVHDEFWLESKDLIEPPEIIEKLKHVPDKPDLFKFSQKLPDVSPKYSYHLEWDNLAVVRVDSYHNWFKNQINRKAKQAITRSQRKGVLIDIPPFTDDLVKGICSIYNEIQVRQGKAFWHYNKPFSVVKEENSSYLERSLFVRASYENEIIGFLKMVINKEVASLMQILTKTSHYDKNPTNALLSKAVEICETNQVKYLTYGKFVYGDKDQSSLTDFKRHNGFEQIDIPCYYVPLTKKGRLALRFGFHKGLELWLPNSIKVGVVEMRKKIYGILFGINR